jgi:hypothetical protein
MTLPDPVEVPDFPSEEDWRWEKEAEDLRHNSLTNVRGTAEKWAGSIAALLGVFSVVAFVQGPEKLADIQNGWIAIFVIILTVAGALLAAAAVYVAALAAQGSPEWVQMLGGQDLKDSIAAKTNTAIGQLVLSRRFAIAAALLVIAGSALAWIDVLLPSEQSTNGRPALVTANGDSRCVRVITDENGALRIAGSDNAITQVSHITLVEACPK